MKPVGRPARYPWEDWFSRSKFTLHRGVDYRCRTYMMAQQIRNAARNNPDRKVHIEIAPDEDSLTVTVEDN